MKQRSVLVVDDDQGVVDWLLEELGERGWVATGRTNPADALAEIARRPFDIVLSDVEMPTMRGLELVQAIHAKRAGQLVVLMTAFGSIELAMQSVRAGAADFLAKPFPIDALLHALERALRERTMRKEIVRLRATLVTAPDREVVARSIGMRRALDLARRAAASRATVLLTGESGVGKSVLARFIHAHSSREAQPFVQLNCAALPAGLVEAELFGVKRGAYTDAHTDREGLLAQADGGTFFLDEIADMPLEAQPKLLLALETGAFRAIGASRERTVDVRLIAASNVPLEDALRERRIRPDLYHRLNVIRIEIPPLRARMEDVPSLVDQTLHRLAKGSDRTVLGVSADAMRWIMSQPWPGNVRELMNTLERAVALSDHDVLTLSDFVEADAPSTDDRWFADAAGESLALDEVERRYIRKVLDQCGGNRARAARVLGVDRTTLWRKLQGTPTPKPE